MREQWAQIGEERGSRRWPLKGAAHMIKVASDRWKAMADSEQYPYIEKYQQMLRNYEEAMKAYLSPDQFSDRAVAPAALPCGEDPPVQDLPVANGSMCGAPLLPSQPMVVPTPARLEPSAPIFGQLQPSAPPLTQGVLPSAMHTGQTHQSSGSAIQPRPPMAPPLLPSNTAATASALPACSVVLPSSNVSSSGDATGNGMCSVCLEGLADTAVVPCGHMCVCFTCMQSIQDSLDAQCPMCRGPITSTIRIYKN